MKKLLICSNESIIAGKFSTGIGEVSDSLALALNKDYDVSVACLDGQGKIASLVGNRQEISQTIHCYTLMNTKFYLVRDGGTLADVVNLLQPDILLNFADANLIDLVDNKPNRTVCVLDLVPKGAVDILALSKYDAITTVSKSYADLLLSQNNELSDLLKQKQFVGITNGILTEVLSPETGLMLPTKYSANFLLGKVVCKNKICEQYGIPKDRFLVVVMGRLIEEKGAQEIIDSIRLIHERGGFVIIAGYGSTQYIQQLDQFTHDDGLIWIPHSVSPPAMLPILAGADFLLYPSKIDACGLMPMTACRYGTIPITTLNGGLADNMNEEIAVIITTLEETFTRVAELYQNKSLLQAKRKAAMTTDFSWNTRKQGYLEVLQ